jgi:hypothetical protein
VTPTRTDFAAAISHLLQGGKIRRKAWLNKKYHLTKTSQYHLTEHDVLATDWELT